MKNIDVIKILQTKGLTATDKHIYLFLLASAPRNQVLLLNCTKLQEELGYSASKIYKAVKKIERQGWIEELGNNGRGRTIRLCPK